MIGTPEERLRRARVSLLGTCLDVIAQTHAMAAAEDRPTSDYADEPAIRIATIHRRPFGIRPLHLERGERSGVWIATLSVGQVSDMAEALADQLGMEVEV